VTDALADLDRRHLWHPFTQHQAWNAEDPLVITDAEGCWLRDAVGRRYLDGVSSLWCNVHGHRVPEIDAAVRAQIDRVAHTTLLGLTHPTAITLAARLAAIAPPGLSRVFYSDSGSTAAEVALKMAFQYHRQRGAPQRTRFATLSGAYHGDTIGAVSVGAIDLFHETFRPLLFPTVVLPAPVTAGGPEEADCLERALAALDAQGDQLAALVVEPLVQGAAGMKHHSPAFLRALVERARSAGALVIADEVAVGFGRTGAMFACALADVRPDLLCLAKGITGGYLPLAATLATDAIYEAFLAAPAAARQFFHGHTYTGNPLACAAALASLDLFEQREVLAHVQALAARFSTHLERVAALPGVAAVRHRGVLVGIDLVTPSGDPYPPEARAGHRLAMAARARGVLLRPLGDTLVINPPLALSLDEADLLFSAVGDLLEAGSFV
jgi:adenosylmethionine-8-amino-7-oxononanoate aminotransferase